MNNYDIGEFLLLRSPTQSAEELICLNNEAIQGAHFAFEQSLKETFSQPELQEAIYLASQNLYDELNKWLNKEHFDAKRQEKLMISLYKYFVRMSTRCTPYGLFAGCEVGSMKDQPTVINLESHYYKHARLDMNVLAEIIDALLTDPIVRAQVKYYPNNSLYATDNAYRYVTYTLKKKRRSYRLSSVRKNAYLDQLLTLAETGVCSTEFVFSLIGLDAGFTQAEADSYVEQMIASQLLVSELAPLITGQEGLPSLIQQLRQLQGTECYVASLEEIKSLLAQQGPAIEQYEQIKSIINQEFVNTSAKDLVQTDLYFRAEKINIQQKQIQRLVNDAEKLLYLSGQEESPRLESFRRKFTAKFGEQEVPLAVALDSELGVGYGLHTSGISDHMPLLKGVRVPGKQEESTIKWSKFMQLKHHKLKEAISAQQQVVHITDDELLALQTESIPLQKLPDSMYLFGTFIAGSAEAIDTGNYTFLFKTLSGPSAANLMGRFCHGSDALNTELQTALEEERQMHPEKIYAEVVHLPQVRTGNILLRPTFGEYEIPYLGRASVAVANQLPISDLMVSCRYGNIVLRSKKHNKEVVPRLSTAHNFSRGLPTYKFLCDMQSQGKVTGSSWTWAPFDKEPFLPRVTFKNIVVSPARWYLSKEEYETSPVNKESDLLQAFEKLRTERKMPRYVALAAGDNELMIDLQCWPALKILKEKWAKSNVVLYEYFQTPDNCFVLGKGGKRTHEVIIPLRKAIDKPLKIPVTKKSISIHQVQRNFSTGSEWLFTKVYTGSKNADSILTEVVKPLTTQLIAQGGIDQWFFIRYTDPEPHLRLRFHHQQQPEFWKPILAQLHQQLDPYLQEGTVHKIQADTYQREIERYGSATMQLSEQLFFYDSEAVINFLDLIDGAEGERYRWLFALRGVDELLNDFGYTTVQKSELLQRLQYGFFQEHHGNDSLRYSLNDKYRTDRQAISEILDPEKDTDYIMPAVRCFQTRSTRSQATIASIKEACLTKTDTSVATLLPSYIHMFLNRMFLSQPRLHELVVYHYLMKHYTSQVAREKKNSLRPLQKILKV